MAILAGDINLVASQVMDDVPEGGGAPIATKLIDGASNQVFPDISELDRAGGRVSLRKVFATVETLDTDTYLGANVIVAESPVDPNVSVTLFTTKETFDVRADAKDRIESYLAPGPEWGGFLFENHIAGQSSLQICQRVGSKLPDIGRTFLLSLNETLATARSQYVRVTEVSSEIRTFTYDTDKDYKALVVTLGLSDKLRTDFPGTSASRSFVRDANKTIFRDTVVADAATYFGVSPLTVAVAIGDVKVKTASIFTQLVPSAQTEIPILNASAAGQTQALVDAATGVATITTSAPFTASQSIYFGNSVFPGSVSITFSGGVLTDSAGQLFAGTTAVGTIDYARGVVAFLTTSQTYSGGKTISFKPAGAPLELSDSAAIDVTQSTRAFNYSMTIDPPPAPGTAQVSYRSNGAWYDLVDNGGGQLRGSDSAFGVGTVSYSTGTVSVTLGALPDDGTQIVLNWGAKVNYLNRSSVALPALKSKIQLSQVGITPGSFVLSWMESVTTPRSATDNGKGVLTGNATGTINYHTGAVEFSTAVLPAGGQQFSAAYSYGPPSTQTFTAPLRTAGTGKLDLQLNKTAIKPGSIQMTWNVLIENYNAISTTPAEMQFRPLTDPYKTVRDDGAGVLRDTLGASYGTVNYAAGTISFQPDTTVSVPYPRYSVVQIGNLGGSNAVAMLGSSGGVAGSIVPVYRNTFSRFEYIPAAAIFPLDESGSVKVEFRSNESSTSITQSFAIAALTFDITDQYSENIVPGSVNFTLGGNTYFDNLGKIFYQLDPTTGAGVLAGSLNYQSGETTINAWASAASSTLALKSLLTTMDGQPVDEATFRVPVAPVRAGSFQLLATRLTGGTVNVTPGADGIISGTNVRGYINYQTGVVRVRFGTLVVAAGNESAIWYKAEAVLADGKIFRPYPVFANTIRYNAVAFTYLPLDADLLGIDPVRLPQDGRVPIFRKGGFVVIGNKQTTTPATAVNAGVVNTGRTRLSRVKVIGNNGVAITSGFTQNLEAGTVTFTNVTGYSQPVRVEHRIEDMLRVSDVQINGELSFTRPATHAYPVGSQVSSALIADNLKARVSFLFDQATWDTTTFIDEVVGAAAAGTYNTVVAPITVTNKGAVSERWALRFTSSTAFQIIGQHVGVIGVSTINETTAPINPATGTPYFTILATGWGTGWSVGNILRLTTVGATFPLWVARTVQQGAESVQDDSFTLLVRGDVDRP